MDRAPGRVGAVIRRVGPVLLPTALAAALVLHGLGARSLWVDEGTTFTTSTQHGRLLWHWMFNEGGNMVAYYGLLHLVLGLFGDGILALRLPSALATVASVPLVFGLVGRLFDRTTAFLAASFLAVCLPLVYWGQMARGYAPAICLLLAATLAFVVAVDGGPRWTWVAFVVLSVLAVSTILLTALAVASLFVSVVLLPRPDLPRRRLLLAAGAIGVGLLPLAVAVSAAGSYPIRWVPPLTSAESVYVWRFLTGGAVITVPLTSTSTLLLVLTLAAWVGALGLLALELRRGARSRRSWALGLVVLSLVGPLGGIYLLSVLVHPVFQDRYLLPVIPAGSILLAVVVARFRPAWLVPVGAVLVIGLRSLQLPSSYGVPVEDWSGAAAWTLARTSSGDCIAFFQNAGYSPFDFTVSSAGPARSRNLPRPVLPATTWASHHLVLDPPTLAGPALATVTAQCPTLWLVLTHVGGPVGPGATDFARQRQTQLVALLDGLDHGYRVTRTGEFRGIEVRRYTRS